MESSFPCLSSCAHSLSLMHAKPIIPFRWGLVASGLFTSPSCLQEAFGHDDHVGWFYSIGRGSLDATLLGNQILAGLFILAWVLATMLPFFVWLNYMGWFRADSLDELTGLDLSYMRKGENTFPRAEDFSEVGVVGEGRKNTEGEGDEGQSQNRPEAPPEQRP